MKKKHLKLYFAIIVPLLAAILFVLLQGRQLEPALLIEQIKSATTQGHTLESARHPLAILLLQIIVILFVARIVGYVFSRIGQQAVIGEITAGIILGPSLLGWVMPDMFGFLFPASSLSNLQLLSQIGLVLFMFIIGMELDVSTLKSRASEAIVVSHVSIVFPYFLGVVLAAFLYKAFAPANISFIPFALFMGIAMSITAFPVLARILKERNMTKTPAGSMAIICAAIGDVTAWCILPFVIAISRAGDVSNAWFSILLAAVYVAIMLFAVKPVLQKLSERYFFNGSIHNHFTALIFLLLLASAYIAELIGIHALFGAFLAGAIMPVNVSLRTIFTERIEDVSTFLLMPLFFAFTGLRTQIGLLNGTYLWSICAIIVAVAVAGKFIGSAAAAKLTGQSWKDSLSIGALMNTRGLMELIVLNIGYDLGILKPEIFTMMVFMALATTFMTAPALNLIEKAFAKTGH
ncbi:MAG TPA: cation:proton antiporter [Chitinophagales bacterium]|nr:cation:proton antiporter [Chitinophagales bacterium]